jgi:hypothetical protein
MSDLSARSDLTDRAVLERHVAEAIDRHRDVAPYVRLVAEALPSRERGPWQRTARALAAGDVPGGIEAARDQAACWIPLIATAPGDPRLEARILQAAARAPRGGGRWAALVSALATAALVMLFMLVLLLLATTVLPLFESMFDDFGMQLPWLTRATLALGPFVRSGWHAWLAALILGGLSWRLLAWHTPRRAAAVADFTRTLARLVAGGVAGDDALVLAARVVAAPAVDPAWPQRPLTHAAVAALEAPPATAAVLLDAVAECHDDRARGASSVGEWLVGPLAIGAVGLLVGTAVIALFLPLVKLVSNLS